MMRKLAILWMGYVLLAIVPAQAEETEKAGEERLEHTGEHPGWLENLPVPEWKVVTNIQALFSNNEEDPNRNKIRIKEVGFGVRGDLLPGVEAFVHPCMEMEYEDGDVEVNVHLDEAYLAAHSIPHVSKVVPLGMLAGRKFMDFGRLNPVHTPEWPFADRPLVFTSLFGQDHWVDNGVQGHLTVTPLHTSWRTTFGFWNGERLGLGHHDEEEDPHAETEHSEAEPIHWDGHVFHLRTALDLSWERRTKATVGYSLAWDEGAHTMLHGGDLTFAFPLPWGLRLLQWQNEFFAAHMNEGDYTRYGGFSLAALEISRHWAAGARYDHTQFLDPSDSDREWAASGFVTLHVNRRLYLRSQYRYREPRHETAEHNAYLQLVFALGSMSEEHAH